MIAAEAEGIWSSQTVCCDMTTVRRIASMLDLPAVPWETRQNIPRGWHFPFLAYDVRRGCLRSDGFPILCHALNDPSFDRLRLLGRRVEIRADLMPDMTLQRTQYIESLEKRDGRGGASIVVNLANRLCLPDRPAALVEEVQTYVIFRGSDERPPRPGSVVDGGTDRAKRITPDSTMLFQYSALGYNTHRVHFDLDYATSTEHLPGLVVNGGLTTLLATEFLRSEFGACLTGITTRHFLPLYANRPLTLFVRETRAGFAVRCADDQGLLAMDGEWRTQ